MVKKQPALLDEGNSEPDRLLTISEVARILNVSRTLIYWLIGRGDLPTVRIRHALRFRSQDVAGYIQKRAELPPPVKRKRKG